MDNDTALKRLKTLAKEDGALRIITPFHVCSPSALVTDAQMAVAPDEVRERCAGIAEEAGHTAGMPGGYREPSHYRLADVKRLVPLKDSASGRYVAYADDELGTSCSGEPAALLARLTEHERGA